MSSPRFRLPEARAALDDGKPHKCFVALEAARWSAAAEGDTGALEEVVDLLGRLLAEHPSWAKQADGLLRDANEALLKANGPSAEERELEDLKASVQGRYATIRRTRAERDGDPVVMWEYEVVEVEAEEVAELLGRMGSLGWELVSASSLSGSRDRLFLKRLAQIASRPALQLGHGVAAAGGAVAGFAYFESGPDMDGDGQVDGGLLDNIGDLFST